jgi:hypothetical protein
MLTTKVSSDLGREFLTQFLFYPNGIFVMISEGEPRIGALSVSISSSNRANTAKVIPSKLNAVFVNTVTEKIALMTNGISIVSLHSKAQLELEDMKAIMGEIMRVLGGRASVEGATELGQSKHKDIEG